MQPGTAVNLAGWGVVSEDPLEYPNEQRKVRPVRLRGEANQGARSTPAASLPACVSTRSGLKCAHLGRR